MKCKALTFFASLFFITGALYIQNITSVYKHESFSIGVHDLMFDYIPKADFSYLYYIEVWILILCIIFIFLSKKNTLSLSYILFSFALFFAIRSIVLLPTGLGTPADQIIPQHEWLGFGIVHYLQHDMFFSGHVGSPFLLALLYWKNSFWRNIFLLITLIMAYAIFAMRIHYSIDIIGALLAAFFVFHASNYLFPRLEKYILLFCNNTAENNKNIPPSTKEKAGPV